jgi:hypothetical protein
MYVSVQCCVLSSRGLHRIDHSSRGVTPTVVCVTVCDREESKMERLWPIRGCCDMKEESAIKNNVCRVIKKRQ